MWFVGTLVYRKLCGYLKVFHSFCPFIVSFTRVKKYDVKSVLYENVFHTCLRNSVKSVLCVYVFHEYFLRNGVDLANTLQHYNMDDEVVETGEEHDKSLSFVRKEGMDDKVVSIYYCI